MDPKLTPTQADPHHDSDVVALAPKDWTDAEEALSRLAHVASDRHRPTAGSDFSAGPRVTEPLLDATLRPASLRNDPLPTDRPSLGRRASRSVARFLVTVCIGVAATLAWQSYGGTAQQMIASAAPQLGRLLSPPAMDPPSGREIAAEPPSPPAVQAFAAPQAASAPQAAPAASETAASTASTAPSPESQQLETMVHDLAAVRQSVEQLAASQELMARDIAKLQTAGQDIRRRISALPPATTTVHRPLPPPQPALQSSVAPSESAPASSAAPLPPEPPSRPPMPVR